MASANTYQTEMISLGSTSVNKAAALLRAGHLVAIPTETVYGLAADAFQPDAVAKIFSVKRRPSFDPLIVHVSAPLSSLEALAAAGLIDLDRMPEAMRKSTASLIRTFWPGPLTLVLPKAKTVPDLVTSGLAQVAIRMPAHKGLQQLLEESGLFLAAPSANLFGRVSPTQAKHVLSDFDGKIPLILDDGACQFGIESTIVEVSADGALTVLRHGSIALEALAGASVGATAKPIAPQAPGMLDKHYAPKVPLVLFKPATCASAGETEDGAAAGIDTWRTAHAKHLEDAKTIGLILPSEGEHTSLITGILNGRQCDVRYLSAKGDSFEAAHHLFAVMREFEETKDMIVAVLPEGQADGLWPAIQDRLQKAANHWV